MQMKVVSIPICIDPLGGPNVGNWSMAKSQGNDMQEKVLQLLNASQKFLLPFAIKALAIQTFLIFGLRTFWFQFWNQGKWLSQTMLLSTNLRKQKYLLKMRGAAYSSCLLILRISIQLKSSGPTLKPKSELQSLFSQLFLRPLIMLFLCRVFNLIYYTWLRARAWALWKATYELCQIEDKHSPEALVQRGIIEDVMNG